MADQERLDDVIDQIQHSVLHQVRHAQPPSPTQIGVDVALAAHSIERFADQTVTVTKQLHYIVTGQKTG